MNYGKVHPIGHKDVQGIFDEEVVIQEKVDGSRFTFGVIDGKLRCWSGSRHNELDLGEVGMFTPAIAHVKMLEATGLLMNGTVAFCEFLGSRKHNKLEYGRVPRNHLVLFDAYSPERGCCKEHSQLSGLADMWQIDVVPVLFEGKVTCPEEITRLLETTSFLGGPKVEGVVCKRYQHGGQLRAKYVSDDFKEIAARRTKAKEGVGIIEDIAECLATEQRFSKAYQAVRDRGKIGGVPEDIPHIIKELCIDLYAESHDYVSSRLLAWGWKQVQREVVRRLPDWYKSKLLKEEI